jgi:cephalosporin hydroxylase
MLTRPQDPPDGDAGDFEKEKTLQVRELGRDERLRRLSLEWMTQASRHRYSYNFTWLGRPIIQFPQDLIAVQELLWRVRPELVIETGVARGGSAVYYASILELLGGRGLVVGIDVDLRDHNRAAIQGHPLAQRIELLDGSSVDAGVVTRVREIAASRQPVFVVLDSNHTHGHVLRELEAYAPLVTVGSYLIVLDTLIEDLPADFFPDRPWSRGNSPRTAVREFLRTHREFEIDREIEWKLAITVAPEGYLRRVRE